MFAPLSNFHEGNEVDKEISKTSFSSRTKSSLNKNYKASDRCVSNWLEMWHEHPARQPAGRMPALQKQSSLEPLPKSLPSWGGTWRMANFLALRGKGWGMGFSCLFHYRTQFRVGFRLLTACQISNALSQFTSSEIWAKFLLLAVATPLFEKCTVLNCLFDLWVKASSVGGCQLLETLKPRCLFLDRP